MLPAGQKQQNDNLDPDVDSDDSEAKPTKRNGRRKIKIEYIEDKNRRHITFSKRKAGIMKKAYELSTLTGTQVLLLVVSETGLVYTFTTTKLQPIVTKPEGKNLIQTCLNTPDPNLPETMIENSADNVQSPQSTSTTSPMIQQPPSAPIPSASTQPYSQPTMPYNNQQQQQQQQQSRYPPYGGNVPQPTQPYPQQQPQQQSQPPYGQPFYGATGPYPPQQQQQQQQQPQGYWNNGQPSPTQQRSNVKQEQQSQQS